MNWQQAVAINMARYPLTPRQCEISWLVVCGLRPRQIARGLGISPKTVQCTLTGIYDRTGARSRVELTLLLLGKQLKGDQHGWQPVGL